MLEASDEDDCFGKVWDSPHCPTSDEDEVTQGPIAVAIHPASIPTRKRKLDQVEFVVLDRGMADDQDSWPCGSRAQNETCRQPEWEQHVTALSLDEYYSHICAPLKAVQVVLSGSAPIDLDGVKVLRQSVLGHFEELVEALRIVPPYGLCKASEAVDLIQEQVTRRDEPGFSEYAVSAGLLKWCDDMEMCFADFAEVGVQEQILLFADVRKKWRCMGPHLIIV